MTLRSTLLGDLARRNRLLGLERPVQGWMSVIATLFSARSLPVILVRLAQYFAQRKLPFLAKAISSVNFVLFGLEVAVNCPIGSGLFFPHTQGTVIGAARIGENAIIYHNVTLGARELDFGYSPSSRPIVGNGVLIASGAKILGPVTIGDNAIIAANAVVLTDVPAGATVAGVPARVVRQRSTC